MADPSVTPYEFGKQNQIVRGRLPALESVYDRFARMLGQTLTMHMRRSVTVSRRATEHVQFKDYLDDIRPPAVLTVYALAPLRGHALMTLEQRLVHVLIDLMFGGSGMLQVSPQKREFTGIETRMISKVLRSSLRDLEEAWKRISPLQARFERMETHPKFTSIVSDDETVVVTTFDVMINRAPMTLSLCVPYLMLDPIRSKLEGSYSLEYTEVNKLNVSRIAENLIKSKMLLKVQLGETRITLKKFLNLKVGDHLVLEQDKDDPLQVMVENVLKFKGFQGAYKGRNAVKIQNLVHRPQRFLDALDLPEKNSPH